MATEAADSTLDELLSEYKELLAEAIQTGKKVLVAAIGKRIGILEVRRSSHRSSKRSPKMDPKRFPLAHNSTKKHKPKTGWKQRYHKDLNSQFKKWWAEGLAKRKTKNFHYQSRSHSEEDSPPSQKVKVELQNQQPKLDVHMPDASTPMAPEEATFKQIIKTNHQSTIICKDGRFWHRDPLGLKTGQFPTDHMKLVNKLIREDSPTPVKKAKANQNTTSRPSAAQNVIQQHRRLVWGKSQLFDVPKEINHQTKVCKKQQKATKIVARRLTKGRVFYAIKNGITKK